jgi:ArsR family transcriptional regulator, arsenate/arsenite/antimonite-responsive transcriptional repressor
MDDVSITVNGRCAMPTPAASFAVQDSGACCASVLAAPLDAADATELAHGFGALADPVRLRVLSIIAAAAEGEVCVCDFVEPLGKSQPTVSHHLKILSEAGLVQGERRGKWVWYSLNRTRLAQLQATIDA